MSETVYFATLILPLATLLIIFGLKYFSSVVAARSQLAGDGAYRALAAKAVDAQRENQASLAIIEAELARASVRLATVEAILKQVDK
ncbi:MAG: hypothetical protein V4857_25360 [Pseudomonadota bacterium]